MFKLRHFNTLLRILYVRTFCNWQLNVQCCKTSLNKNLIHLLRGKSYLNLPGYCEKKIKVPKSTNYFVNCLCHCKNCSQAFAGNEALTSLLRKFASVA